MDIPVINYFAFLPSMHFQLARYLFEVDDSEALFVCTLLVRKTVGLSLCSDRQICPEMKESTLMHTKFSKCHKVLLLALLPHFNITYV